MAVKSKVVRFTMDELVARQAANPYVLPADAAEANDLGDEFWANARLVMPKGKKSVHLRVDVEVYDWFKNQGEGHLTRMNAVLRTYFEARKSQR